jgi:putative oxidoreductase
VAYIGVPRKTYLHKDSRRDYYMGKGMMTTFRDIGIFLLRLATAANFLSPVASRFDLWGQQSSGWKNFLAYAAQVNSFAPPSLVHFLAIASTVLEITFPMMLIVGFRTRIAATGASILTFIFAVTMTYSFGIKSPLDYGVFVDCASAFLLATMPSYRWSIDAKLSGK